MGKTKKMTIDAGRAREFQLAFGTYVRSETRLRDTTARQMAVLDPAVFVAQMGEVPQDVAVIFSAEVAVGDTIAWSEVLSRKGEARVAAMRRLLAGGQRPFRFATATHPAKALFEGLLTRADGIELCAAVSGYLAWAAQQPSYRTHLFTGDGAAVDAPAEADAGEEATEAEAGSDRSGLLFDEREDDSDPSDPDEEPAGRGSASNDALYEREENDDDDE